MSKATKRLRVAGVGGVVAAVAVGMTLTGAVTASATSSFSFDRIGGVDRYDTSALTAEAGWTAATDVILASGEKGHFADALAATYLAGVKGAPILLTQNAKTPDKIKTELVRLGVKTVWIAGGTDVVSADQEAALKASGYTVNRLGGADRYETAQLISDAAGDSASGEALVATGLNFADALGGGAVAYAKKMPVALVQTNSVPADTLQALKDANVTKVVILGGSDVVGAGVVTQLKAAGITVVTQLAGVDRADTSAQLANYAIANWGFSNTAVNLATGQAVLDGVDALGGAALSGKENRPLLLTVNSATSPGKAVTDYVTAHANTLATGHIFGDTAAVAQTIEDAVTAAAKAVTSKTFTVTTTGTAGQFGYADTAQAKQVTQKYAATDVFTVDGKAASLGVFEASATGLTVGDQVEILADTPTKGVTTFNLTNKSVAANNTDYTSGLVGDVNTDVAAHSFKILEPVTATPLNSIDYIGTGYTFYKVDGATVTQTAFEADINEGDAVSVTGKDTLAEPRTIALTNQTVSGTVATKGANTFSVASAAGAILGDVANDAAATVYTLTAGDKITIDGKADTLANFNTAVSVDDKVTYSRAGGVQTVALTNTAPAAVTGLVAGTPAAATLSYVVGDATSATTAVDVSTGYTLTVNGAVSTVAEFNAAITAGDQVTVQAADSGTSTAASVTLVDKSLVGQVTDVQVGSHTVDVLSSGKAELVGNLSYTTAGSVYAGNTTNAYFVGGVTKTIAEFDFALSQVANGTNTASLQVVDNGNTTEWRLTTAANTASATMTSVANPGVAGAVTSLTVTFDKPVYLAAAAAATDFTLSGAAVTGGTPATVTYVDATPKTGTLSNTVTLKITSIQFGAGALNVALTSTGAAKFLDANGKAVTAGTFTVTVS